MPVIHLKREGFLKTIYKVRDERDNLLTKVICPFWLTRILGAFVIDEKEYEILVKGWLRREFQLRSEQTVIARAEYRSTFLHYLLEINLLGRKMSLQNVFIGNLAELKENDRVLGTITEEFGFLNSPVHADMSEGIALPELIFFCFIAIQMWSRNMHLTRGHPSQT